MPEFKRYASGEITMEAYLKEEKATYDTGGFNLIILLLSMGIFGWIWLCIGSGLAFKLGTGEVE